MIAYFDCSSGISGDMVLGAFVDAGLPLKKLKSELAKLPLFKHELRLAKRKGGMRGANLSVEPLSEPPHGDYKGIDSAIAGSRLSKPVRETARAIFAKLAWAEAAVHRIPVDRVHFHEVGATDSVVDVVGAAIGVEHFGLCEIHSSPLPMSRGSVDCAHGTLGVPAPAALEIMKGIPLESTPVREEIVTPTGAAIIATVASHFGECPLQRVERVGYGFGDKRIPGLPNSLRILMGEGFPAVVIEADVDDMSPELFENAAAKIFAAGAAEVHLEPVQMKKGRPGVKIVAVAPWSAKDAAIGAILEETTSFGVRYWPVERKVLVRELVTERVRGKGLCFKVGIDGAGRVLKVVPEYEGMKKIAAKTKRPLMEIHQEALAVAASILHRRRRS